MDLRAWRLSLPTMDLQAQRMNLPTMDLQAWRLILHAWILRWIYGLKDWVCPQCKECNEFLGLKTEFTRDGFAGAKNECKEWVCPQWVHGLDELLCLRKGRLSLPVMDLRVQRMNFPAMDLWAQRMNLPTMQAQRMSLPKMNGFWAQGMSPQTSTCCCCCCHFHCFPCHLNPCHCWTPPLSARNALDHKVGCYIKK